MEKEYRNSCIRQQKCRTASIAKPGRPNCVDRFRAGEREGESSRSEMKDKCNTVIGPEQVDDKPECDEEHQQNDIERNTDRGVVTDKRDRLPESLSSEIDDISDMIPAQYE